MFQSRISAGATAKLRSSERLDANITWSYDVEGLCKEMRGSYLRCSRAFEQYCHVGNTAQQCRLGLLQGSDFAGDLEDSKSTSGVTLCIFGSHTFVPTSWMCKKQTTVSHS